MTHRLLAYHDAIEPNVYRWNERLALVQLSRFALTLVPLEGDTGDLDAPDDTRRRIMSTLLETPASSLASIRFGDLSTWANRRTSEQTPVDSDGVGNFTYERAQDCQRVLGAVYDRAVVRESLQWMYQHSVACDAWVDVRSIVVRNVRHQSTNKLVSEGRALVMRCDKWTGFVLCCAGANGGEALHGDDPLFPEGE